MGGYHKYELNVIINSSSINCRDTIIHAFVEGIKAFVNQSYGVTSSGHLIQRYNPGMWNILNKYNIKNIIYDFPPTHLPRLSCKKSCKLTVAPRYTSIGTMVLLEVSLIKGSTLCNVCNMLQLYING